MPDFQPTAADQQQYRALIQDPSFLGLPDAQKKTKIKAIPAFRSLDEPTLNSLLGVIQKDAPKPAQPTPAPSGVPKPESLTSRVGTDLALGFRQGLSEAAQTWGNITRIKSLTDKAKTTAPTAKEMAGRESLLDALAQGVGELPGNVAKYFPALVAGKWAPAVAGVMGAAGEAHKGVIPAVEAGVRDTAGFWLQGKAAKLSTRLGRTAASAAAMAAPNLVQTGDPQQVLSSLILGGAMGAISPKPGAGAKTSGRAAEGAIKSFTDDLAANLAPASRGPESAMTARIARAHLGEAAQRADQAEFALRKARDYFDTQKPTPGAPGGLSQPAFNFIDYIEKGVSGRIFQQTAAIPPELQPYAQAIRKAFDERGREMQRMGLLRSWVDDYFPHLWKEPDDAKALYQAMAKRPLEGTKSFLRERRFASLADGLRYAQKNPTFKMEMVTTNPIDMALLQLRQMDKLITAKNILGEMKGNGILEFYKDKKSVPAGYKQIDDRVSTVMFKSPKSNLWSIAGYYYAPEPAARIINNYLSPGLSSKQWFRAPRLAANVMNQFQLGWSAFHLGFTTFDAMISNIALGTEKIVEGVKSGKGKYISEGIKEYGKAPFVAIDPLLSPLQKSITGRPGLSSQLIEEWMKPGTHPTVAPLVEYAKQAGARVQLDPFYKTSMWRSMRASFKQGDPIMAALKLPFALNEVMAKPIMEYAVPRQKLGAFARLAEFEMSRLKPGYTQDDLRGVMQKAWDSVDNRMGQLVYDNLFWNRMAKEGLMTTVRSVGWNLGTFREIPGGIYDLATIAKRIKNGDQAFTHRMAYTATLPVTVAMLGGVTNYLNTQGNKNPDGSIDDGHPKGMVDLFYPRTGRFDENGQPERISFPTYMNDVSHWVEATRTEGLKGAAKVLGGKMHPALSAMFDLWQDQDWRGQTIWASEDPGTVELHDGLMFLAKQAQPLSSRYVVDDLLKPEGVPSQYTTGEKIGAFVGIRPAPSYIKQSDAEKYLDRNQRMTGPRTKESGARFDVIREAAQAKRAGSDPKAVAQQELAAGKISKEQVPGVLKDARNRAKESPLVRKFNRATVDVALNAYRMALEDLDRISHDELVQLRKMTQRKVYADAQHIKNMEPKTKAEKIKQIQDLGLKVPGAGGSTEEETTPPPPGR